MSPRRERGEQHRCAGFETESSKCQPEIKAALKPLAGRRRRLVQGTAGTAGPLRGHRGVIRSWGWSAPLVASVTPGHPVHVVSACCTGTCSGSPPIPRVEAVATPRACLIARVAFPSRAQASTCSPPRARPTSRPRTASSMMNVAVAIWAPRPGWFGPSGRCPECWRRSQPPPRSGRPRQPELLSLRRTEVQTASP